MLGAMSEPLTFLNAFFRKTFRKEISALGADKEGMEGTIHSMGL